jgi:hypothetical protein
MRRTHFLVQPVQSTTLSTAGYDPVSQCLRLEFRSRAVYLYFRVPPHVHDALMAAVSKGAYFNRNIRGRFPYQKQSPDTRD